MIEIICHIEAEGVHDGAYSHHDYDKDLTRWWNSRVKSMVFSRDGGNRFTMDASVLVEIDGDDPIDIEEIHDSAIDIMKDFVFHDDGPSNNCFRRSIVFENINVYYPLTASDVDEHIMEIINDIHPGDKVVWRDPETDEEELITIQAIDVSHPEVIHITKDDGGELECRINDLVILENK